MGRQKRVLGGSQTAFKLDCKRAGMHYGMNAENRTICKILDSPLEAQNNKTLIDRKQNGKYYICLNLLCIL